MCTTNKTLWPTNIHIYVYMLCIYSYVLVQTKEIEDCCLMVLLYMQFILFIKSLLLGIL